MWLPKLRRVFAVFVLTLSLPVQADVVMFGNGVNRFSMEFASIGALGNVADTTGSPNPAGEVAYNYGMGKFEVSEDMITKYNLNFGTANGREITKDAVGSNKPATSVSWNEAARFINWLNTSTGGSAAYKFTTTGVNDNIVLWAPTDTLDYNAANPYRSRRANYVLPSFNEWYKAAYYDPNLNLYFDFATGSDTTPQAVASGTAPGTAVYGGQVGPADVNDAGGLSPFGIMGLGGNVFEWQETEIDQVNNDPSFFRMIRGGDYRDTAFLTSSLAWSNVTPTSEFTRTGFRVVSLSLAIPEPNSMLLVGLATCAHCCSRRHRKEPLFD